MIKRASRITFSLAAASFLAAALPAAPAVASPAARHASPCGKNTSAAVTVNLLVALSPASVSPSDSPSATTSPSASASSASPSTASSTGAASSSPSDTSSPSPSPTSSSPSPTTSSTPSPSPSRSHTKSPSPSPSPKHHRAGALCVTNQLVANSTQTFPGGFVTYSIWVWSTVRTIGVTATLSHKARSQMAPAFIMCPTVNKNTCKLGTLPANRATEMLVTDQGKKTAQPGDPINLTVTINGNSRSPATATVTTMVTKRGNGETILPPLPPVPPVTLVPPGAVITPPTLSGLFPTVTPSATPAVTPDNPNSSSSSGNVTRVAQVSSSLPLA